MEPGAAKELMSVRPALLTLVCLLLAVAPARGETLVSSTSGDGVQTQLTKMLAELQLVPPSRISQTVRQLRFLGQKYELDPFLLTAVCAQETQWPYAAKGHLFAYNLKQNLQSFQTTQSVPHPFSDLDTCAYGLKLQKDTFGNDLNAMLAAYFAGPSQTEQWAGKYPDDIKALIEQIWTRVSTYQGPLKASAKGAAGQQPAAGQPAGARGAYPHRGGVDRPPIQANSYTDAVGKSYAGNTVAASQVEEAYILTMRHFNKRLREDIAREIYYAIARYAAEYAGTVDARLVMALVATESNFNPQAVSRAGAQGLGQLMPFTADSLNVLNPFDIDQNIRGTYAYLDREFKRWAGYNDLLDRVLAAYNAGPGAVSKFNGIPPYAETQAYVPKVLNIYCAILQPHERRAHLRGHSQYAESLLAKYEH